MSSRLLRLFISVAVVLVQVAGASDTAWAQTGLPQEVPRNVLPGVADVMIQKNVQQNTRQEQPKKDTQVNVVPVQEDGETVKLPSFKLEEIQIRNATILTREDLAPIIGPMMGRTVTEAELINVSRQITALYHQKGYLTCRAFLPSQVVRNGIVVILAQESRVGNISVEGAKYVDPDWILKQLTAKKGEVFNIKQLETELKRIQQSPRIFEIRADIKPGEEPGTNDTVLRIVDRRPYQVVQGFDNLGRETIGQLHYSTTVVAQDVLGLGHQAIVSYTGASGLQSIFGQYAIPLNDWGWTIGARASHGKTKIGGPFDHLRIRGTSDIYSLFTTVPVVKKERLSLVGDLSFNGKSSDTSILGVRIEPLDQEVESVTLGYNLFSHDKWGRWLVGNHVDFSVGSESRFFKLSGDFKRWLTLPKGMVLVLKSQGQFAPDNMPGLEQMQIGGFSTVRGYPEGFLIADSGFVLGSELHMPMWGMPDVIQKNLEWLVFMEGGNVYVADPDDPSTRGQEGKILSVGLGLRGRISRYLSGRLDIGFAQKMDQDEPTARIHFGLTGSPF